MSLALHAVRPCATRCRIRRLLEVAGWSLLLLASAASAASAQGYRKWYLAEGATGSAADFIEEILIANPGSEDAQVRITLLPGTGAAPPPYDLTVKATSRATVRVNTLPGVADGAVSAVVESRNDVDIVVERTMYWPPATRRGGHNSTGVTAPATRWFLAEGSTGYFNTFILVANPDPAQTARVKVTFLRPGGGMVVYKRNGVDEWFDVAPGTRTNVWPNAEVADFGSGEAFSTVVESQPNANGQTVPIIAERAMYWDNGVPGSFEGGHNSAGVTASSLTWLLAEGTTRSAPGLSFNTFLLLSNPNPSPARARVLFFTAPGTAPLERFYPLAADSRENVWANVIPELADKDFSVRVESVPPTDGGPAQPLVVERSVYWGPPTGPPFPNWVDGHNTPGVTAEAAKWVFSEGLEDGFVDAPGLNFDTYFLISNSSKTPLDLRVTFVREDGTGIVRDFKASTGNAIGAESRFTMAGFQFPEVTNQRFATFFESLNGVPFVAERAVYWGGGYYGGHASTGVPWTGTIATPPASAQHTITTIVPNVGPVSGGTAVTITGTSFASGATVTIGGVPATSVVVVNATTITAVTGARQSATDETVAVVVRSADADTILPGAFTYQAPKQPQVDAISPIEGPSHGGTTVTLTGLDFAGSATVSFGGVPAKSVTFVSPTELKAVSPARTVLGSSLDVTVTVFSSGLQATAPESFTYYPATATDTSLAFGDSITDGVTSVIVSTPLGLVVQPVPCGGCARSYPVKLQSLLTQRYTRQAITVTESGNPGEFTGDGVERLPGTITPKQDLVLIMEGANDVNACASVADIVSNLKAMVATADAAGKKVLLATLTPHDDNDVPPACSSSPAERVRAVNEEIRTIAYDPTLNVELVDVYAALSVNLALYLSADRLHPSDAGYTRMAEVFRDAIVQLFESVPPVVP